MSSDVPGLLSRRYATFQRTICLPVDLPTANKDPSREHSAAERPFPQRWKTCSFGVLGTMTAAWVHRYRVGAPHV